ncbi:SRPBCC family protein [Pontibacter sp. 172403-2]|uniref:SRPBCC family protein n=1 Tax=Pontibacter rufus TaxID=2791028 RepID=UPI0018AFA694|nr:SRPBCC family protein [Pontibacter sp. 172403-2]MBF9255567.1 SRPBCC family protein [Pontibacter sp. 172403-2]
MKLIWKMVLPLPVLAAAFCGIAYRLPTQVQAEHRVVLRVSPEQVYPYLNNPMEWPKWSALSKAADPSIIYLYGGPMTGVGARMQWSGDKLGDGSLQLTASTSPNSIAYVQRETSLPDSVFGEFTLTPATGGTEVTWRQTSAIGTNPLDRYVGLYRQYKKQQEVEQGLEGLKMLVLQNAKRSASKD